MFEIVTSVLNGVGFVVQGQMYCHPMRTSCDGVSSKAVGVPPLRSDQWMVIVCGVEVTGKFVMAGLHVPVHVPAVPALATLFETCAT